jgi:zinc protease
LYTARSVRAHVATAFMVVLLASRTAPAALAPEDPLPVDPELIRGVLPNGVRYWIAPNHRVGDAAVWMKMDVGSLYEEAGEEGLAHFVEHMAFRGTEHHPHDSVTRHLESLGLTVGSDQNAVTTLPGTTYKLNLPTGAAGGIADALTVLADFAFRRAATPGDVARERPVILEELRSSETPANRLDNDLFETIFAGTRTAGHLPLGRARVIENATLASIQSFVTRWYRPERTTVIVTGDVDPGAVVTLIEREFGAFGATTPAPTEPSSLAGLRDVARTIVTRDAEQTDAQVRIIDVEPLRPILTVGDLERDLARRVAFRLVDERLRDAADSGAPFESAFVETISSVGGAVREEIVRGATKASQWPRLVTALPSAIEDMTRSGFTPEELEVARRALLTDARSRAALAPTRPAAVRAADLSASVSAGERPLSAADCLPLYEALLPLIDPAPNRWTVSLRCLSCLPLCNGLEDGGRLSA